MNKSKTTKKEKKSSKPRILDPATLRNMDDVMELNELNAGIMRINDSIDSYEAEEVLRNFEYLRSINPKETVVHITSPGGSIYHALAVYDDIVDYAKTHKTKAIVGGFAASAASMIVLQAFPKRIAKRNARFLLHEPRQFSFGVERASDSKDNEREMEHLNDIVIDILEKRCKINRKKLVKLIERKESWLSAEEAKEIGLIDEIS